MLLSVEPERKKKIIRTNVLEPIKFSAKQLIVDNLSRQMLTVQAIIRYKIVGDTYN